MGLGQTSAKTLSFLVYLYIGTDYDPWWKREVNDMTAYLLGNYQASTLTHGLAPQTAGLQSTFL